MLSIAVFKITGLSPLLQHNPASMLAHKSGGINVKQIPLPEDEAEAATYRLENGDLYLPTYHFRASLLRGCVGRRLGKRGASVAVSAGVSVPEEETVLFNSETGKSIRDYQVDCRTVVVQRARIVRARPKIWPWAARLVLELNDDFISAGATLELLNIAGMIAGIGDFRPEKRGWFGRYSAQPVADKTAGAVDKIKAIV